MSATCSSGPPWRRGGRVLAAVLGGLGLAGAVSLPAAAQAVLTQQEGLRLAFPEPATIERRTAYLTDAEVDSARARAGAGVDVGLAVVPYYVGVREGEALGVAYFDVHRVRTLPEVVMVVVTPDARVERVEILRFSEPPEYRPPDGWLRQFRGKALTEALALKRDIVNMTGATLSSQAVTAAVRRVLALHGVIRPFERVNGG